MTEIDDDRRERIGDVIKETVRTEQGALTHLLRDETVEDLLAVARVIDDATGQIVFTGVGKSGDVGKKITATFNSIGVTSQFIHPVEALHGDLGVVSEDDVVLFISNSGNTEETVELQKVLSTFQPTTVAITSDRNSKLGSQSEYCIQTGVSAEGSVVDEVPMASATTTMVVGDCLANALMQLRDFEEEDFGYLHPGGTIGKRLLLDVSDIAYEDIPRTTPDDSLAETAVKMSRGGKGLAVVRNEDDEVLGILTDGDLRRYIESDTDLHATTAGAAMTEDPLVIGPDEPAIRALNVIQANDVTQLVVTDEEGRFCGVVHFHDIMQEGLST
mgnify:CR=1 FL=1